MTKRYVNIFTLFILTFSCSGGYHWGLIKKTDNRQWNISAKSGKSKPFLILALESYVTFFLEENILYF